MLFSQSPATCPRKKTALIYLDTFRKVVSKSGANAGVPSASNSIYFTGIHALPHFHSGVKKWCHAEISVLRRPFNRLIPNPISFFRFFLFLPFQKSLSPLLFFNSLIYISLSPKLIREITSLLCTLNRARLCPINRCKTRAYRQREENQTLYY